MLFLGHYLNKDNFLLSFKRGVNDKWLYNDIYNLEYIQEFGNRFGYRLGIKNWAQQPAGGREWGSGRVTPRATRPGPAICFGAETLLSARRPGCFPAPGNTQGCHAIPKILPNPAPETPETRLSDRPVSEGGIRAGPFR